MFNGSPQNSLHVGYFFPSFAPSNFQVNATLRSASLDALTGVAQLIGRCPANQKVAGWIPKFRKHAWVVGLVPGRGVYERQPTDTSILQ